MGIKTGLKVGLIVLVLVEAEVAGKGHCIRGEVVVCAFHVNWVRSVRGRAVLGPYINLLSPLVLICRFPACVVPQGPSVSRQGFHGRGVGGWCVCGGVSKLVLSVILLSVKVITLPLRKVKTFSIHMERQHASSALK